MKEQNIFYGPCRILQVWSQRDWTPVHIAMMDIYFCACEAKMLAQVDESSFPDVFLAF